MWKYDYKLNMSQIQENLGSEKLKMCYRGCEKLCWMMWMQLNQTHTHKPMQIILPSAMILRTYGYAQPYGCQVLKFHEKQLLLHYFYVVVVCR